MTEAFFIFTTGQNSFPVLAGEKKQTDIVAL
jgi:hypothetical protein